jgi:uncharacterized protein (UPF0335 family)
MTGFDDNGTAQEGHNSDGVENAAASQLRSYIERVERLNEEKDVITEDIKEVFSEAKAMGYEVGAIRKIVAIRKRDKDDVANEKAVMDQYYRALGMDFML